MFLTNPIWLWALVGLLIPIGIHLLSRKEGKVIRIGSLRHLQETNTQQFKGIRLNEIVLLMLRCLLIILFVLLMSGLSFERATTSETKWVLLEKGLEKVREVQAQLETFQNNGYELRWLAEGFPLVEDSASLSSNNLYWKLTEQLQSVEISDIIVISKNRIEGFKGMRPQIPTNVRWISVPLEAVDFTATAKTKGDSIVVRAGHTQADKTYFTTQTFFRDNWNQTTQPGSIDTIEIVIVADNSHRYDKRIVEASLRAMELSYPIMMKIVNASPEKINATGYGDWCIWLLEQSPSDSLQAKIIYLKPNLNREILVQEKANRWSITKRLNEEVVFNESLTVKLASLVLSSQSDFENALLSDKRMFTDNSIWSGSDSRDSNKASFLVQSADSYLLIAFLLTFLVERILAYYRNQ